MGISSKTIKDSFRFVIADLILLRLNSVNMESRYDTGVNECE